MFTQKHVKIHLTLKKGGSLVHLDHEPLSLLLFHLILCCGELMLQYFVWDGIFSSKQSAIADKSCFPYETLILWVKQRQNGAVTEIVAVVQASRAN